MNNLRQNFELAHLCMVTIKETGELISDENLQKLETIMMDAILQLKEEMFDSSDNTTRKPPEQDPGLPDLFEGS